jgi:hypothetical protein
MVTLLYEYRHKVRRVFPRAAAAAFPPCCPPCRRLMASMSARTTPPAAGHQQAAAVTVERDGGYVPRLGVRVSGVSRSFRQ